MTFIALPWGNYPPPQLTAAQVTISSLELLQMCELYTLNEHHMPIYCVTVSHRTHCGKQ